MKRLGELLFVVVCIGLGLFSASAKDQNFNDAWLFFNHQADGAEAVGFDDSGWRKLDLPHDWAIEGPFDVKYNARCGGLPFHGTGWYRKHFATPQSYNFV